jgi:hypothetical protein
MVVDGWYDQWLGRKAGRKGVVGIGSKVDL